MSMLSQINEHLTLDRPSIAAVTMADSDEVLVGCNGISSTVL